LWVGITAIHKGVYECVLGHLLFGSDIAECLKMMDMGMDASIGQEADEMNIFVMLPGVLHGLENYGMLVELSIAYSFVDAGELLINDSAGA